MAQGTAQARGGIPETAKFNGTGQPADAHDTTKGLPRVDLRIDAESDLKDEKIRKGIIDGITSNASRLRKEEHKKRHEVYSDRTKEYTVRLLHKEFTDAAARIEVENRTPNVSIVRKIVDKKARVYKNPPARIVIGEERPADAAGKPSKVSPSQTFIDEVSKLLCLDKKMKQANRKLELHKNILVGPRPVVEGGDSGEQKFCIELGIWQPEYYDVVTDRETGLKPVVIIFSYLTQATADAGSTDHRTGSGVNQSVEGASADKNNQPNQRFVFWSDKYHFTTNEKGQIIAADSPEEKDGDTPLNPVAMLPFVSINKDQDSSYWAEGGEDLCDNAILINMLLADLFYIEKYQGLGILFATGKEVPKNLSIGPNKLIGMSYNKDEDPEPKLGIVNAAVPIEGHLRSIETLLGFTLSTNNLEPGDISGKLESPKSAQSGIQEIIQQSEVTTAIEDEEEVFRMKESMVFKIAVAWMNLYRDKKMLAPKFEAVQVPSGFESLEYSLTFDPPQPKTSEMETANTLKALKECGFYTFRELVAKAHPELTEEEITKKIEELKAENAEREAAAMEKFKMQAEAQGKPPVDAPKGKPGFPPKKPGKSEDE